jgi:hypothetical protein
MDFLDLLGLLSFAAVAWLWHDSLAVREAAVAAAKAACSGEDLLLLDDTVAIARIGVGRDGGGALRLRRVYSFEFSDTGNDRRPGSIVMLGRRVLVIRLDLAEKSEQAKTLH